MYASVSGCVYVCVCVCVYVLVCWCELLCVCVRERERERERGRMMMTNTLFFKVVNKHTGALLHSALAQRESTQPKYIYRPKQW